MTPLYKLQRSSTWTPTLTSCSAKGSLTLSSLALLCFRNFSCCFTCYFFALLHPIQMPPQRSGAAVDVNAVHATVLRALIESGEWDKSVMTWLLLLWKAERKCNRIRALFVSRLNESGFIDSMRNAAKGPFKDMQHFHSLTTNATDEAAKSDIPFETLRAKMIVPAHSTYIAVSSTFGMWRSQNGHERKASLNCTDRA